MLCDAFLERCAQVRPDDAVALTATTMARLHVVPARQPRPAVAVRRGGPPRTLALLHRCAPLPRGAWWHAEYGEWLGDEVGHDHFDPTPRRNAAKILLATTTVTSTTTVAATQVASGPARGSVRPSSPPSCPGRVLDDVLPNGRRDRQDRQRQLFADALAVCQTYKEYPYIVRRRRGEHAAEDRNASPLISAQRSTRSTSSRPCCVPKPPRLHWPTSPWSGRSAASLAARSAAAGPLPRPTATAACRSPTSTCLG